jgi:LysM repeat protein
MNNRWGIHAPNAGFHRMTDFYNAGFQNYTVLHVNQDLIPQIRSKYPAARIVVRMYLQNWYTKNPAEWSQEINDIANSLRQHNIEVTWANEQNLDLEGHPQGASPSNQLPPASLYQDINRWNLEMIRRLRQMLPWARLHYPAFANGHSDDKNQGGYVGLEICRPGIELADVMDCHCYWNVNDGPLTLDGGQRFVFTRNLFPNKEIFISECGNFAAQDQRTPDQYITFIHSLYNYDYIEGATFFIWDSDDAPGNVPNIIQTNGALVNTLRNVPKDPPANLPPVPASPARPPHVEPIPQPVPANGADYLVLPGDTLSAIAKRFGVELVRLMNDNHISDARTLRAGQHLHIPGNQGVPPPMPDQPPTTPPQPTTPQTPTLPPTAPVGTGSIYIVHSGDTLSAIAKRFNSTVAAIVAANNLANADMIRPGQQLIIPKPSLVLSVAEATAVEQASKPQVGVLGIGDPTTPMVSVAEIKAYLVGKRTTFYVTRKGDTISRIAGLFHADALILSQINQVGMQGEIMPGTRLIIPMK